jgi:hypothetical protein
MVAAYPKEGDQDMALTPGSKLGSYRVLEQIGAGGMGVVYRALDVKLNRDVALKVLPGAFSTDEDRLARFQREARVAASLNHPNIAAIHGLEDQEDVHFLVLEFVPGETLADREWSTTPHLCRLELYTPPVREFAGPGCAPSRHPQPAESSHCRQQQDSRPWVPPPVPRFRSVAGTP